MKLSVVMIVKNEEDCLANCLESVKDADEIVILDTGSTDGTAEIAKKYTDKFIEGEYEWNDDFAEARNKAASYATGDWILVVDADEVLEPGGIAKIKNSVEILGKDFYAIRFKRITGTELCVIRIYRNNGKIFYQYPIHEVLNLTGETTPLDITVTDYISKNHGIDPDRNFRIIKKAFEKNPEESRFMYFYASELFIRFKYNDALPIFYQYLAVSKHEQEICEVYKMMARSYSAKDDYKNARVFSGMAVTTNPNDKEAIRLFMNFCKEKHIGKWLKLLIDATNEDVLVIK